MEWSHYSEAIAEAYMHGQDNLIVEACPGSGKTTNIARLWGLDDRSTCYVVFNKQNQVEAVSKLPPKVHSSILTLNSLGHRALMNAFGAVQLDTHKVRNIVRDTVVPVWKRQRLLPTFIREQEYALIRAVDVCKQSVLDSYVEPALLDELLYVYDLEGYEGIHADVNSVLMQSDDTTSIIDYNDQIRLPCLYKVGFPQFDVVLGDEVQDFNAVKAALVQCMGAPRVVMVGDSHQAIYGFAGAMADSMEHLKETFQCTALPLSISYRCSYAVVAEAVAIYSDIEAWQHAAAGSVQRCTPSRIPPVVQSVPDTMVVCRCNAPLVRLAYTLLAQGIPCYVRGRSIGEGLVSLIRKQDVQTVSALIDALHAWHATASYAACSTEDTAKLHSLQDKYDSLMLFCGQCDLHDHPQCVIDAIAAMFTQGRGVCLSTIHKAKGLEAHQCILLDSHLYGQCRARCGQEWQRVQEDNLQFVAVTRAKETLVYA